MMRALAIAFGLIVAATAARAECMFTFEDAVTVSTLHAERDGGSFRDYGGSDAAALLKAINEDPPATEYRADHILVLRRTNGTVKLMMTLMRGTAMPLDKWMSLEATAFGAPL